MLRYAPAHTFAEYGEFPEWVVAQSGLRLTTTDFLLDWMLHRHEAERGKYPHAILSAHGTGERGGF